MAGLSGPAICPDNVLVGTLNRVMIVELAVPAFWWASLYPTSTAAHAVADALVQAGHQVRNMDIIDHADPAAMTAEGVSVRAAAAHAKPMTGGQALLVIRAPPVAH